MPYTAWPTNAELLEELNRLGVSLPSDSTVVSNYVDQAVAFVSTIIGAPFIEAASADYLIDAPYSANLYLSSWYSAITAIAVGVSEVDTTGTVLNIGTDVFLRKNPAGKIHSLQFLSPIFGSQESIKITGTKGYAANIPADLWQSVLDYAVALCVDRNKAFAGDMRTVEMKSVKVEFLGSVEPEKWLKARKAAVKEAAEPYRVHPGVY